MQQIIIDGDQPTERHCFNALLYKVEKIFENKWAKLGDENIYRILNKYSGEFKNGTISSLIGESNSFSLYYKKQQPIGYQYFQSGTQFMK